MQIAITADQLAALAQTRERLNRLAIWAVWALLLFSAASAMYNVFQVGQPWLRLGQVWGLSVIVYLAGPILQRGISRRATHELPARYLLREHEDRSRAYLWIRRRLWLFVPGMASSWWGVAQARSRGAGAFPWILSDWFGAFPFLATGACLLVVWYALGRSAERSGREAEAVRRNIEQ